MKKFNTFLSICLCLSMILGNLNSSTALAFENTDNILVSDPPPPPSVTQKREKRAANLKQAGVKHENYAAGEILVKYKNSKIDLQTAAGRTIASKLVTSKSLENKEDLRRSNVSVLKIKDAKTVEEKVVELKSDPNVEYAEPNYLRYPTGNGAYDTYDDTYKANLWGLDNTGQMVNGVSGTNDADIDAPETWMITDVPTPSQVIVAIIDTGVEYDHPDLINNMWDGTNCKDENGAPLTGCKHGYDFEDNDIDPVPTYSPHGTEIAGIIAAAKNNKGVIGVAPNARIMAIKFGFDVASEVKAIDFAIQNGAKIINASFTGTVFSQSEFDAISRFRSSGGIFIAAAGNNSGNNEVAHQYPSDINLGNIISVAATDQNDTLASFSNYSAISVDVGAPGTNIYTTSTSSNDAGAPVKDIFTTSTSSDISFDTYTFSNGTSMAAPYVAGLAALIIGYNSSLTPSRVISTILTTGDSLPTLSGKTVSGKRINAYAAILSIDASKEISSFAIAGQVGSTTINEADHTILLIMPFATDLSTLAPNITIFGSSVSPLSNQARDFTNSVIYTVTAADTSTTSYAVNVTTTGNPDITAVANDKNALDDSFITGENADLSHITVALTDPLPAVGSVSSSTITWTASSTSYISNDGQTVVRPVFGSSDVTVTLTATITKGLITDSKIFTSIVLAETVDGNIAIAQAVIDQIAALPTVANLVLTDSTAVANASSSYSALTGVQKALVTNFAVLAAAHTQISALSTASTTVAELETAVATDLTIGTNLTAAITAATTTHTALLAVAAGGAKTALVDRYNAVVGTVANATIAADKIALVDSLIKGENADLSHITVALTNPLPVTGPNGSAISWVSSSTAVVSNDGQTVNRPIYAQGDTTVTLTATISVGIPTMCDGSCEGTASTTKVFTLTVVRSAGITAFSFPEGTGVITGTDIEVSMAYGTVLTALVPTIEISAGTVSPASGVARDFTGSVTYTVTAPDSSTKNYTVTVSVRANTSADMLSFSSRNPIASGVISGNNITMTLPFGSGLADLPISISLPDGASVNPMAGNATFVEGVASIYTVTAQDASTTKEYHVTVRVASNTAKDITSFDLEALSPKVTGVISGTNIALSVPYATNVTALVPTIGITGASSSPANGVAVDLSGPVTYTVTAADGSTKVYTVTVTVLPETTPPIITLVGTNPMSLTVGGSFTDPGATANDNIDGSVIVIITGSVDTNTVGAYTITYTATDSANNKATATRIVNVLPAPIMSSGGNPTTTSPSPAPAQIPATTVTATTTATTTPGVTKLASASGDYTFDKYDFSLMMSSWGKMGANNSDYNKDGKVDEYDFALLMANWTK
ncbi:MAG: S8 family serine peptidase [Candidatus Taylorbacteria bacterium]